MTILWFYYFFGTLQCAILTLALERDPKAWILTSHIELTSVLYSVRRVETGKSTYLLAIYAQLDSNYESAYNLISNILQAVFGSAVTYSVLTWCIDKKGPVFVVMFKPLGIAIAAFMSTIFLGDTLYIGR